MTEFQRETCITFDKLRRGEKKISDMSSRELKHYMTGLAFYKKSERNHFDEIQKQIYRRLVHQGCRYPNNGRKLQIQKQKKTVVDSARERTPNQKQNFGVRFKRWVENTFPCFQSKKSDIEMKLITYKQEEI